MPISIEDVKNFLDRHPELQGVKETVIKMVQGLSSSDGSINCEAIEWIFPGTELVKQFFAELDRPKI